MDPQPHDDRMTSYSISVLVYQPQLFSALGFQQASQHAGQVCVVVLLGMNWLLSSVSIIPLLNRFSLQHLGLLLAKTVLELLQKPSNQNLQQAENCLCAAMESLPGLQTICGIGLPYRKPCSLCVTKQLEMEICAQEYLRTVLSKINLRSEKKTEIIFKNL